MVEIDNIIANLPLMTRIYIMSCTALMILCSLDIISPLSLYMSWKLVFKGEIWRLVTCFLYFGPFGVNFFWNIYVLIHYCSSLERVSMNNKPADFLWMLICSAIMVLFFSIFFGSSLFFSGCMINVMTYVWGRKNPYAQMAILFFTVPAPYLPWILTAMSYFVDFQLGENLLGIFVGHVYYFFKDVYPSMPTSCGLSIFDTPSCVKNFMGQT
ncbi:Der1-like family [Babesia microti strain RI]|uniref:Derlin n=1 Tax=Babesia microti (strain RI) TaxID=1133968 RepID=I7J8T5_BABMR|nr:Der1-like family [Babesia microti strain RI]CCF72999.1 Der1-like family [Babesia microti strain RI]|eukprot:XP_012647608.1 Der1-like family [Babesia microti strain RI]